MGLEQNMRADTLLFGESQSRIIISAKPEDLPKIEKIAGDHQVPFSVIGKVEGQNLKIDGMIDLPVKQLADVYEHAIERIMERELEVV